MLEDRYKFFHVSQTLWNDWHWQVRHALRSPRALLRVLGLTFPEEIVQGAEQAARKFRMQVTPYYAALLQEKLRTLQLPAERSLDFLQEPLFIQAFPQAAELTLAPNEQRDPLAEERYMPVPGLTHRYPDRVLLYASPLCSFYCRHCNRRRKVGDPNSRMRAGEFAAAFQYIAEHPEIRDVLISGGDPLLLSDTRLEFILRAIRAIEHVEIIRLATRVPVTLPQRITGSLTRMLKKYAPLYVHTQFNHPDEGTPEAALALKLLIEESGVVLGNQMVLLRGVNEQVAVVKRLNHWLLKNRVRPYYIFACDAAEGLTHFRTSLKTGVELIAGLRGFTSGLAVPHFVVDLPGGGGKIAVEPPYLVATQASFTEALAGEKILIENYRQELFVYEP